LRLNTTRAISSSLLSHAEALVKTSPATSKANSIFETEHFPVPHGSSTGTRSYSRISISNSYKFVKKIQM